MSTIKEYLEYEKNNVQPNEDDFFGVLNKIEIKEAPKNKNFVKSPFWGWSFGLVGVSMAAFMFFFGPAEQNPNQVAIIQKEEIESIKQKTQNTVDIIDSINSFDSNSNTGK